MGEVLNEYFSCVYRGERHELGEVSGDILGTVHITVEKVLEVLEHMKVDKCSGPDQIYPRTLQEARKEIAGALAYIFASSLATGKVPEDWRVVNVVPLFKKDCKEKPGNYRPVSLVCGCSGRLDHMESGESWQIRYTISLMGPLLFVIYISDLDENVQGMISKFVDDTKIGSIVDSEE
eukprot:g20472.t1